MGASTALLKPGKDATKKSASLLKSQKSILKNVVQSAIKTNKPTKYSKITGVKGLKLPKPPVMPMGKFLSAQMGKAMKSFKRK